MSATPEAILTDIGVRALADQKSRVDELRKSGPVVLTATAAPAVPLGPVVLKGSHPEGVVEWVATVTAFSGAAAAVIGAVVVLWSFGLKFELDAAERRELQREVKGRNAARELQRRLVERMGDRERDNEVAIATIRRAHHVAWCAVVIELAGLVGAAVLAAA